MKETTKVKELEDEIAKIKKQFKEKYDVKLIIISPADNIKRLTIININVSSGCQLLQLLRKVTHTFQV